MYLFCLAERSNIAIEEEEMAGGAISGNRYCFRPGRDIVLVPVVHVDQSGFGVIVRITVGAFHDILARIGKRDDGPGAAFFTNGARNRSRYSYIATHWWN